MKKKLFALSGVFLIVLVITGLWATKAFDLMETHEQSDPLAATSQVPGLSMKEMAIKSDFIGVVECRGTTSERRGRSLVTLAEFLVVETVKGNVGAGTSLTVVTPGGISTEGKFHYATTIAGAPQFYTGAKNFLFLENTEGDYVVKGFAQGQYSVVEDKDGRPVVMRDLTRVRVHNDVGNRQAIPLEEFKKMVMGYLQ